MSYTFDMNISLNCITKEELLDRMQSGADMVIVDPIGTYDGNKFKIKGAQTIPYYDVIDRRNELRPYKEVVVYCKHKECVASKKVAAGLTLLHFDNVKVYEGGIDEWVAHGLPVENCIP